MTFGIIETSLNVVAGYMYENTSRKAPYVLSMGLFLFTSVITLIFGLAGKVREDNQSKPKNPKSIKQSSE